MLANSKLRLIVTDECNLDCYYCHNEGQSKGTRFIELAMVREVVQAILDIGEPVKEVTISGGEPLLHPELDDLVRLLGDLGCPISITTNGLLLSPSRAINLHSAGVSRVRLGIDSMDPRKPRPSKGYLAEAFDAGAVVASVRDTGMEVTLNSVLTKFAWRSSQALLGFCVENGLDAKFFEEVVVLRRGGSGLQGEMRSVASVSGEQFRDRLSEQFGERVTGPERSDGVDDVYTVADSELRYARFLCDFGKCWLSGTRVDASGFIFTCMQNRGSRRVYDDSSIAETLRWASEQRCPQSAVSLSGLADLDCTR